MPLKSGIQNFRSNVEELMQKPQSKSRRKAINTIAKKHGITKADAQFKQALAIARSMNHK